LAEVHVHNRCERSRFVALDEYQALPGLSHEREANDAARIRSSRLDRTASNDEAHKRRRRCARLYVLKGELVGMRSRPCRAEPADVAERAQRDQEEWTAGPTIHRSSRHHDEQHRDDREA
jgi:uncharacterized membrane protein YccC